MTLNGVCRMNESEIREALNRHWAASDANDFDAEHDMYHDDAVLEYPQSGERIRGRHNIQASRAAQPNSKRFQVHRIVGRGELWVTEFILTHDGKPCYTVSILEFRGRRGCTGDVVLCRSIRGSAWRAHWVERMDT